MTDIITYTQCSTCKERIQSEWLSFHNCEQEAKLKEIEGKLQGSLDENLKLKIQNSELKKSIESIRKEINLSFKQMKSIVEGYYKKIEDKKEDEKIDESKK